MRHFLEIFYVCPVTLSPWSWTFWTDTRQTSYSSPGEHWQQFWSCTELSLEWLNGRELNPMT